MLSKICISILLFFPMLSLAAPKHDHGKVGGKLDTLCKFAPENDLEIPVGFTDANEMTEQDFNRILDRVEKHYRPILEAKGKNFDLQRDWQNSQVNAFAQQRGNTWIIKMFGGLARHDLVTLDGFALVACHEMGHHLGGAPKRFGWASNEGQSDYYATTKCARRIWREDDNVAIMERRVRQGLVSETAKAACVQAKNNPQERALCLRSAMGGLSLGATLASLGRQAEPSFETPDTSVVRRTNNAHPRGQCRMDTYFQGALCEVSYLVDFDDRDPEVGACTRAKGHDVGLRPLCWYKPGQARSRGRQFPRRVASL